ncbi:MAG: hypothetical protein LBU11_00040 [Zoogloeaceae bacterium]|nr:hypothetical protein [Zoogloeaceae bacterium]
MSLDKPSVHVRLAPEQHAQLAALAEAEDRDMAGLAASLLEAAIVGRFHTFRVAADRLSRMGFSGNNREREGS